MSSLGKHFINDVTDPVDRALRGLLVGDERLRLMSSEKVLYLQRPESQNKVLLLSGGGSGHEPAHAGYIGEGMLDIVVSGNIFASPSAAQVSAGLQALQSTKGTLMIVKNYTGDKLNFGLAAEKAKIHGRQVNVVFVGDDVAVEGNELVGQRGLAGVVFVHKIAGALAATGANLDQVTSIANKVASSLRTVAASLDRCSVPQRGKQEGLPFDEMEYGMGIHNEPGASRGKLASLENTVSTMLETLLQRSVASLTSQTRVALMVNNLGGLSVLEMTVIAEEVLKQVTAKGLRVSRSLTGTFVTSLDGPGFSITVLEVDIEIEQLLDAPTSAPAWPRKLATVDIGSIEKQQISAPIATPEIAQHVPALSVDGVVISKIINSIAKATQEDEPLITEYDTIAGDGDCGETLLNGVTALVHNSTFTQAERVDMTSIFQQTASIAERSMGGTSGAIYAIFLNAVAAALAKVPLDAPCEVPLSSYLSKALKKGLEELYRYTTARKGHRTLMDALIPFVEVLEKSNDIESAFAAAREGAESTKSLGAQLGRASYVSKEIFKEKGGIPDPGALGVVSILRGLKSGLSNHVMERVDSGV